MNYIYWLLGYQTDKENDKDQQKYQRKEMKLTELSDFSVKYIKIYEWELGPNKELSKKLKYLNSAITKYQNDLNNHLKYKPEKFTLLENVNTDQQRKYQILISVFNDFTQEMFDDKEALFNENIRLLAEMNTFCENVVKNSYPISIDIDQFLKDLYERVNQMNNSTKNKKIVNYLRSEIKKASYTIQNTQTTDKTMIKEINDNIEQYDAKYDFISSQHLDDVFEDYIKDNFKKEFDEIIKFLAFSNNSSGLECFFNLLAKITSRLKISEDDEVRMNILSCVAIRYMFARVNVETVIISNNLTGPNFFKNCEILRNMKLGNAKLHAPLFSESLSDRTFEEIFMDNEYLKKSVENVSMMQFYYSPIDIAMCANAAIEACSMYLENFDNQKGQMKAFDDLFVPFYISLSISPPQNIFAIRDLMSNFSRLITNGNLEYACTSIQGSVAHIANFKKEDFCKE